MRHDAAKRCPLGRVATLALVSAFALPLLSSPATAARASASRGAVEDPPPVVAPRTLDVKPVAPGGNELLLRRAAMELRLGNLHTVVENLEGIGFSAPSSFVGTDRAAFLLGQAYLRLGAHDRFVRLARVVSEWERESIYTQWVAYQLLLVDAETGAGSAPDSSQTQRLVVARGLAAGTPLGLYLEALGRSAGADAERTWTELSDADTASVLGRDLAGAALLRRATLMIQRGEDPRTLLQAVPPGSRYASRALHMLGVVCMERGDGERGAAVLDSLLADDPDYAARREVRLALAGQALDQNRWEDADRIYQSIDRDWTGHRDTLQRILSGNAFDSLWPAWQRGNALSDALPLDALPSRMLAERLAAASTDFGAGPSLAMPPLDAPPPRATLAWPVASPPPAAWSALAISERRLGETRYELERTRWTIDREREALGDWRRYLDIGFDRAGREADSLRARSTLLDSLRRTLDALDARLVTVRDESTHRLLARTAELLRSCENSLLWLRAMRHFHVDGPNHARATTAPTGLPSQEMLVTNEAALARAVLGFAERFAAETPALIARSYQDAWRPGLIDRAWTLGDDVKSYLAWARKLGTSIDSSIAAASSSERLRRLEALAAQLDRTTDSLAVAHEQLRTRVAREAVERTLATLASEREGIDYGLAASAYGLAVGLGEPDAGTRTASSDLTAATESTPDSAAAASENDTAPESPEAARSRAHAIERLRSFLAAHPGSFARGEMRFRLADLLIVDGRQQFRERMARYVRAQAEGRAPGASLPVLSHAPALELYRTILQEDREFEHRDAVLFNAGMILADEADPEAARFFGDLVTQHPESPYRQQAYLRMGDLRFNHKQFAECIELYRHAADGPDTSLRAIALYKMGWAHFNEDRFLPAADAFRAVLDLYQARSGIKLQVDIEREAETYFVHALARAGGAEAFAGTFDRIGARPYEIRILMALGQHFRRYSLYAEATAVDELGLKRYPLHPDALIGAQRLIETHQRRGRLDQARQARLEVASRFVPASAWAKAQASDSVRSAGSQFARASWKTVALEHHRKARDAGSRDDWREALQLYQKLLSTWPEDAEAPALRLNAGEASAQLGEYPAALEHYAAAAATGRDSVASHALWQRVAVTDAWYQSTRAARGRERTGLGSDSLGRAVITAGDELLDRFSDHPESGSILWRQANLAFGHGWFERAASDFGRMIVEHPKDARSPVAAGLRADALFRTERFEAAGIAYEEALTAARRAGLDSLERHAAAAIPISWYRHAESVVAADSSNHAQHAALFEKLATRWPQYEHAHVARYRAGLAYLRAGSARDAVRVLEALIRDHPKSEYVQDAHLQIAHAWEAAGEREKAAQAYADFAERYPKDASAGDAWLKAADLFAAAGSEPKADALRLTYIRTFPNDVENAMEILEGLGRRELAGIAPGRPISSLLMASGSSKTAAASSHLADYLRRAEAHPKLASPSLLAQVRFLEGEEANTAYSAARLPQPLERSIPAKQKLLEKTLASYRKAVDLGVPEWAHASAFRIGEALVAFGEALEKSQRPADLTGDDLVAYEDVLYRQRDGFFDRGEGVWMELLRSQSREAQADEWIARTRTSLWGRLANRFYFRPEVEFPLAAASPPGRLRPDSKASDTESATARESLGTAPERTPGAHQP